MTTELTALDTPGWMNLKDQALVLVKSGFLPEAVRTPEQAIAIIMKGRELRLPPMASFNHIHVIKGKPAQSAECMRALILRDVSGAKMRFLERTNERCTIRASRPGGEPEEFTFTLEDAKRAQLLGNPSWTKYPRAMLMARCTSEMARAMFPDVLMGCSYTPEELGAEVSEDGEIIDVPAEPPRLSRSEKARVTEQNAEKFTGTDDQKTRLANRLKALKIDESLWERIGALMMNHPILPNELSMAVRGAEIEASRDPMDMDKPRGGVPHEDTSALRDGGA